MSAYFDGLQRAQFGGIFFPIADLMISSTQRHHIHEYPHTPGGALEKLGRKVYTIRMSPIFDESIRSYDNDNGLRLYPDALERLQFLYEEETTTALTIPTLGTIDAYMTSFSRRMDAMIRSGERVDVEFVEDQTKVFLVEQTERVGPGALPDMVAWVKRESVAAGLPKIDLFDLIADLANQVFAIFDQGERFLNRVAAKLDALSQLIQRADSKLQVLQHPGSWRVVEALKELAASVNALKSTLTGEQFGPRKYVVPREMTIQQVSMALYRTTERTMDLLRMNDIDDALMLPAGTQIRYFP